MPKVVEEKLGTRTAGEPDILSQTWLLAVSGSPTDYNRIIFTATDACRLVEANIVLDTNLGTEAVNWTNFLLKAASTALTSTETNKTVALTALAERDFTVTYANASLSAGDTVVLRVEPETASSTDLSTVRATVTLALQPA